MTDATTRLSTIALALVLALSVVAGTAVAASNASIAADSADPGATTTHTVTVTVGDASAGSWNGLAVNYTDAGANLGNVGQGDVVTVGIDRDDDASGDAIDVNVADDVSSVGASSDGEILTVGLGGNYDVDDGDELVVVYESVQHPEEAGSYVTPLDVNPQSSGGEATATLTVGQGTSDDTPTTDGAGDGDATTDAPSGGDDGDDSDDDSEGSAPGFGLTAALFAVGAAALLAQRR